jgi:hypothetical protein
VREFAVASRLRAHSEKEDAEADFNEERVCTAEPKTFVLCRYDY